MNQIETPLHPSVRPAEVAAAAPFGLSDPQSAPTPFYARWAIPLLNDARDASFIGLMLECALAGACGIALWCSHLNLLFAGPVYVGLLLAWVVDRFTLMLHCTSHRPLFRPKYRALNHVIPWLLGPFLGHTPNTYFAHHIAMHHLEENLEKDLSQTISFRRDRFSHWLRYYLRFMLIGLYELTSYLARKKRYKVLKNVMIGEGLYWSAILVLGFFRPAATFVVFVAPLILIRTLMMAGNWGQHAFVCAAQPENAYRSSIVCVNTRYNRRCFNDGYHILHHLKPRCHWSDHSREFERDLESYGEHDAIVFEGIDFFQVWLYLMLGQWQALARHFVQLPGAPVRNQEDVIAFLRGRVQPIAAS